MTILLILHGFITLALIGIILLQKSDASGLGFGGGGNSNSLLSTRGTANLLTRVTAVLAALFMLNCLCMSIYSNHQVKQNTSIVDR